MSTEWRVVGDSNGFYGVPTIAQDAADEHCRRYGHSAAVMGPVVVGTLARCTACGRSIALLESVGGG